MDVGDALRGHATDQLDEAVTKYFARALEATVTFAPEAHRKVRVDITVRPGRGLIVQGGGQGDDAYAAFDGALNRIAKQLRRYKRRLKDHHKAREDDGLLQAQQYVLAADDGEDEVAEDANPAVIAEMQTEIATLTVGEAVMRMDLADLTVMMFRNRAHGGLNVVYRRTDGHIGWIDPSDVRSQQR
jgi:ribosomal subunit interface protein